MSSPNQTKIFQAFVAASRVLNEYWMHTEGDHENGDVSIENMEKAIENLSDVSINKEKIDFEGSIIRSKIERDENHNARVFLRANQSLAWLRYSSMKEYSHILLDGKEDYEPDATITLAELFETNGTFLSDEDSPAKRSERIAEILALELIYPFEWRKDDKALIERGEKYAVLEKGRGVPAAHIQRALNADYITTCGEMWKMINDLQHHHTDNEQDT